jgi:hypothetical protein
MEAVGDIFKAVEMKMISTASLGRGQNDWQFWCVESISEQIDGAWSVLPRVDAPLRTGAADVGRRRRALL